jgi:hypothetical protein
MQTDTKLVERFHRILVEEIHRGAPEYLEGTFTVAEIYQSLVPYRTHRDRLGVRMNGDYEDALLRLLAGQGEYLVLESEPARTKIRRELDQSNPNTGIYREFAAVGVRLNPARIGTVPTTSMAEPVDGPPRDLQTTLDELDSESRPTVDPPSRKMAAAEPTIPEPSGRESGDRCPECEGDLPDRENLRFCPRCGTNLLIVACRKCGEALERSWQYCVACGEPTKV